MLRAGIVGLPNVGKSTLFNALTSSYQAESANYPFCTIEPNQGVVQVPDQRLYKLSEMAGSAKTIPSVFEFVDIAGLVKGASTGAGLGNQFLSHIREVDAIVQVIRCFEDENITHVEGEVNAVRDAEIITMELALADAQSIEKRLERLKKGRKGALKEMVMEAEVLEKILPAVSEGEAVNMSQFTEKEQDAIKSMNLLSVKPVLFAANVKEEELGSPQDNPNVKALMEFAQSQNRQVVIISAQIEAELCELPEEEKQDYLQSLGVQDSGVNKLIRAAYKTLGYKTYFTVGPKEARAWAFVEGMSAPECAGIIHTDFERGFIKAEVTSYDDFIASGGERQAKEKGLMRQEGRDYVMKDGDVVHFLFNV